MDTIYDYNKIVSKEIDIKSIMDFSKEEEVVFDFICAQIQPRDYHFNFVKTYICNYEFPIDELKKYAKDRGVILDDDMILEVLGNMFGNIFEVRFDSKAISGINILDRYVICPKEGTIRIRINDYIIRAIDPNEYDDEDEDWDFTIRTQVVDSDEYDEDEE